MARSKLDIKPSVRFRLPPASRKKGLLENSPFGLNLQMELRDWSFDEMAAAMQTCRQMGIRWSREEFHWAHIMPERGQFVWDRIDRAVELSLEAGVSIMGLFAYWDGPWSHETGPVVRWTDAYNEGGIRDYCELIRQSVRRFKDRIHYWQIWNEPNGRTDEKTGKPILTGFWKGTPKQYADMLKAAYQTCKEEDPDCTVVGFNMALPDVQWLEMMGEYGVMDCADVVSYHPYRCKQKPEDKSNALTAWALDQDHPLRHADAVDEARAVRQVVRRWSAGHKDKPIWITEMSWSAALNDWGVQEIDIVRYLLRYYLLLLGPGGIGKIFWYDLRTYNVGLAREDFSARYLSVAVNLLSQLIEGKKFRHAYAAGQGNYAHLWTSRSVEVLALWTANPTPQVVAVDLAEPDEYKLYDMLGVPHVAGPSDTKSPTLLTLSESPRFLVTKRNNIKTVTPVENHLYELPPDFGPGPTPPDPYASKAP